MTRTRLAPLVLATALLGAVATPSPAAAASCKAAKSKTLAQNASARVYEVATADGSTLYGCLKATGRRMKLDTAKDDITVAGTYRTIRLAGHRVAWVSILTDQSCKADCPPGFEPTTNRIRSADLKRRRIRSITGLPEGDALVVSSRNGGVAWAAKVPGGLVEIHTSVSGTEDEVVDSGIIDPATLAIEITIISWVRDGAERYARLR